MYLSYIKRYRYSFTIYIWTNESRLLFKLRLGFDYIAFLRPSNVEKKT